MPVPSILGPRQRLVIICVATGVLYGLAARLLFGMEGPLTVMGLSFIFVVPVAATSPSI